MSNTDHLGGSSVVSDADGNLEETTDYYPFGGIRLDEKEGSFNEQRKFTGHEYDAETGLNYMGARYQSGAVGRFMSEDQSFLLLGQDSDRTKLVESLSEPQKLNSYSYVENSPMNKVDPTGKASTLAWILNPIGTSAQINFWNLGSNLLANSSVAGSSRPASAALMEHSLESNPSSVSINENNQTNYGNVVDELKNSPELQSYIGSKIESVKGNTIDTRSLNESTAFRNGDLFSALGKVDIS